MIRIFSYELLTHILFLFLSFAVQHVQAESITGNYSLSVGIGIIMIASNNEFVFSGNGVIPSQSIEDPKYYIHSVNMYTNSPCAMFAVSTGYVGLETGIQVETEFQFNNLQLKGDGIDVKNNLQQIQTNMWNSTNWSLFVNVGANTLASKQHARDSNFGWDVIFGLGYTHQSNISGVYAFDGLYGSNTQGTSNRFYALGDFDGYSGGSFAAKVRLGILSIVKPNVVVGANIVGLLTGPVSNFKGYISSLESFNASNRSPVALFSSIPDIETSSYWLGAFEIKMACYFT